LFVRVLSELDVSFVVLFERSTVLHNCTGSGNQRVIVLVGGLFDYIVTEEEGKTILRAECLDEYNRIGCVKR